MTITKEKAQEIIKAMENFIVEQDEKGSLSYIETGYYHDDEKQEFRVFVCEDGSDYDLLEDFLENTLNVKEYEVSDYLEITYSDSTSDCIECYRYIAQDVFGGTPNTWFSEYGLVCENCVVNNMKDEYVEALINNPDIANTILSKDDLHDYGFERLNNEYEHGMYGTRQNPKDILERIGSEDREVIFMIDDMNPFAVYYSVFVRDVEVEEE